jgi:hypothetical protein
MIGRHQNSSEKEQKMRKSVGFFLFAILPILGWSQTPAVSFPHSVNWSTSGQTYNYAGRHFQSSAVMNNKLWVIGGQASGKILSDVLSSTDGLNWNQATPSAAFGPRWGQASVAFNAGQGDALWVIGGTDGKTFLNDVWQSTDGITWNLVTANAPFAGRVRENLVVFHHKLWVIAGKTSTAFLNDIWSSPDGKNWTQAAPSQSFQPRYSSTLTVYHNGLWLIGGQSSTGALNDVWFSANGVNWSNKTTQAGFPARSSHSAEVYQDILWIFAGHDVGVNTDFNDAWWSSDGSAWHQAVPSGNYTSRWAQSSGVFNNQIWVISGAEGPKEKPVDYSDIWDMGSGSSTSSVSLTSGSPIVSAVISPGDIHAGQPIQLSLTLAQPVMVQWTIFSPSGEKLFEIIKEEESGLNTLFWPGTNVNQPQGLYSYAIETEGSSPATLMGNISIAP